MSHHEAQEALKAAPAIAGTGYTLMGLPLSDWAAILTCIYVLFQIYFLLTPKVRAWLSKRASSKRVSPPL